MRKKATHPVRRIQDRPGITNAIDKLGGPPLWTPDDVCAYLQWTPGVLRGFIFRRKIPHFKYGRQIRFRKADIDRWFEEHMRAAQ